MTDGAAYLAFLDELGELVWETGIIIDRVIVRGDFNAHSSLRFSYLKLEE